MTLKKLGVTVGMAVGSLLALYFVVIVVGIVSDPLGLKSGGTPTPIPDSIRTAPSDSPDGYPIGFSWANPKALTAYQLETSVYRFTFVDADQASTSLEIVSVRIVSKSIWIGAARGKSGGCYAIRAEVVEFSTPKVTYGSVATPFCSAQNIDESKIRLSDPYDVKTVHATPASA